MRRVAEWFAHHALMFVVLFSVSTVLGFAAGASYFIGGWPWERSLEMSQYLSSVLLVPSGLIWVSNVFRDLRANPFY